MKILVDAGVGISVEQWLVDSGHDVKSVRLLDPRMEDDAVLTMAVGEGRLVLTMDKDFGEMVHRSGRYHAGVLLLRMDDADGEAKRRVVAQILSGHGERLVGRFSVFKHGCLRVRG